MKHTTKKLTALLLIGAIGMAGGSAPNVTLNVYAESSSNGSAITNEKTNNTTTVADAYIKNYSDDTVLVSFSSDTSKGKIKKALDDVASSYEVVFGDFDINKELPEEEYNDLEEFVNQGDYDIVISATLKDSVEPEEAVEELENKEIVESAGVDCAYYPEAEIQPYINYYSYTASNQTIGYGCNAIGAWETLADVEHDKVEVAVIDSGVYMENPDLKGIVSEDLSVNVVVEKQNGEYKKLKNLSGDEQYCSYHGTNVSNIIAAKCNNGVGTKGFASANNNDIVEIIAINAAKKDEKGNVLFYNSDIIKGITYAINQGAKVINMSLGGYGYSSSVQSVVNDAYEAGLTVVASAGNDRKNTILTPHYPSDYEHVISVGAVDYSRKISVWSNISGSNYGTQDICANGTNVSCYGDLARGVYNGNGTSYSAPIVTATVAMILSACPNATPDKIEEYLKDSATTLQAEANMPETEYGSGMLNAGYALKTALIKNNTPIIKKISKVTTNNSPSSRYLFLGPAYTGGKGVNLTFASVPGATYKIYRGGHTANNVIGTVTASSATTTFTDSVVSHTINSTYIYYVDGTFSQSGANESSVTTSAFKFIRFYNGYLYY